MRIATKLRGLWAEFHVFAFQGNLVELAVAVVIGAAFTNLIHAVVTDLVNPTIAHVVHSVRAVREQTVVVAAEVGLAARERHPADQPPTPAAPRRATVPTTLPDDPRLAVLSQEVRDLLRAVAEQQQRQPSGSATSAAPTEMFKAVDLHWEIAGYPIGHFVGELVNFAIVAFAIFLLIVKLLGSMAVAPAGPPRAGGPSSRECPECLSIIPARARRCAHCGAAVDAAGAGADSPPQ